MLEHLRQIQAKKTEQIIQNETKMKTITFEASSVNIVPNATNLSIEVDLRDIEIANLLDEIGEREVVNYLEEKGCTINN